MYVFHKLIKIKTKHYEHPVQLICQRTKFIFQTKVIKDYETHLDNVIFKYDKSRINFFSKCTSQDQYNTSMLKKGLKFL